MLKNILSLLLSRFYSKKESGEVAHQAMPGASSTALLSNAAVNDWGTISSGVAAADGYLVLTARNAGNAGASLSLNVGEVARQSLTYPFIGAGGNAFVPIGKGDSWALIGSNSDHITLRLFKTIGGGVQAVSKLLLQGGGLCLSHWFSSLRRSSWLARRNGWLISRLIFLRPLQKLPSLLTENATPSQCLTRASWFCNVTASCLQDLTDLTWSISEREQTATSAFLFIPRKATLFLTRLANPTTSEPQTCTSIRLTVANNLSIGGVSC